MKQKKNSQNDCSFVTKLTYGLGEFPGTLIVSIINFLLMNFLTDYLKIDPIWAGVITFLGIVFDAITDPWAGYLSDNSTSKWGRRRSFMLKFTVPLGISVLLLFCIPQLFTQSSEFLKVLVVLVLYLLYILLITLYKTPYGAIASDLTKDYDTRTSLAAFRTTFIVIATLASVIIPDLLGLSKITPSSGNAFFKMGLIMCILIIVFGLISGFFVKEKNVEHTKQKYSFKKYFIDSLKIKPFRQVCFNFLFTNLCITTINMALIYFLNYYVELPKLFTPISGGVVILAMFFIPLFSKICKVKSKNFTQNLAAICMIVGLVILIFIPRLGLSYQDGLTTVETSMGASLKAFPWYAYIGVVLIAFGFGAFEMIPYSLMPDAIDFCIDKEHKDEGAYYGVVSFVFKVGKSLPSLFLGLILQICQYQEPNFDESLVNVVQTQSDLARFGIALVFIGLPILFALASILIMRKYNITREKLTSQNQELQGGTNENENNV